MQFGLSLDLPRVSTFLVLRLSLIYTSLGEYVPEVRTSAPTGSESEFSSFLLCPLTKNICEFNMPSCKILQMHALMIYGPQNLLLDLYNRFNTNYMSERKERIKISFDYNDI